MGKKSKQPSRSNKQVNNDKVWIIFVLLLNFSIALASSDVHPWTRQSRFLAFRFELKSSNTERNGDIKIAIRNKGNELFCFGWTQTSPKQTVVGEARCNKEAGKSLQVFLESLVGKSRISIRFYGDTLIRLHPTSFKLILQGRITCFRDEPHQCDHYYYEGEDGTAYRDR